MKKIIALFIIAIAATVAIQSRQASTRQRTKCFCGHLYYDWDGRPRGLLVPVLKNDNMVECE
jgi:hypothetical protein